MKKVQVVIILKQFLNLAVNLIQKKIQIMIPIINLSKLMNVLNLDYQNKTNLSGISNNLETKKLN